MSLPVPPALQALHQRVLLATALTQLRHELRNKLGSISNAAFYLQRQVEKKAPELWRADERVARFFALIASEVNEGRELLAPPGSDEAPAEARIDAAALARAHLDALGAAITMAPGDAGVTLVGDPAELSLALHCLLENAVDAAAGTVTVRCVQRPVGAAIEVVDDGPEPALGRALEPFFTTKPGRLGLGLNIAAWIARRWAGSIEVTRGPQGTVAALVIAPE